MKKVLLSLSALVLLSTASFAEEAKNSGLYAGLGYGITSLDLEANGIKDFDGGSNGLKIYGGYQFNKVVGIELAYNDFGKFDGKYGTNYSESPTNISLSANLGYAFLDGQLRPFTTLGLGQMNLTRNGYENRRSETYSLDKTLISFNAGLGLTYKPTTLEGIGFRFAVEYFGTPDEDHAAYNIDGSVIYDDTWKTSVTNTYLGVEYQF